MMRRLGILSGVILLLNCPVYAGTIDSDLEAVLDSTAPDQVVSTLVYLLDQADVKGMTAQLDGQRATLRARHETIVVALQQHALGTQTQLLAELESKTRAGDVAFHENYWIGNIIRLDATPATIRAIAEHEDVDIIYPNYQIELIEPVKAGTVEVGGGDRGIETGVVAVRAPEVWALGFTGEGILVANMDTGVDGNHPALASRWAGVADPRYATHPEWAYYDPYTGYTFPADSNGHGTHTMGSVCGGAPGDQVGVAPGALWIAMAPIDRGGGIARTVSDAILSFQWMVDPDGNPATNWDVPHVCSNSWGLTESMGYPDCDTTFWSYMDNCEAAGIVILFSAGNEGSSGLRKPPDRATTEYTSCAVASVNANVSGWPISDFSSRGPTYCTPDGSVAIKPDIAAPGEDVRSAYPGGGYTTLSGTSMASPHVNGVVALIRQANPDLSVDQVKQILYDTAVDLGTAGEDNTYGWGMVDAYEAVQLALSTVSLTFSFPDGRPEYIDPNGGTTIRVEVTGQAVTPEPGSGLFYYSDGGSYTSVPMNQVSPNVYDAVFPSFDCGATVTYYFSAESTDSEVVYNPYSAPSTAYSALAYTGTIVFFEDDFQSDQGWTVYAGADTGDWERADPQEVVEGWWDPVTTQPEDDHSPDGTLCFVTGPLSGSGSGDYDVDGGPSHLTSPAFDLEDSDATVSYWRWYHISTQLDDDLVVAVSNDDGASWVTVETVSSRVTWTQAEWRIGDYVTPTAQVRVRFTVDDSPNNSLVEALIDDFKIYAFYCDETGCDGDFNNDGIVDLSDLSALLANYGATSGMECEDGDMDGDGDIDLSDLSALLAVYGSNP